MVMTEVEPRMTTKHDNAESKVRGSLQTSHHWVFEDPPLHVLHSPEEQFLSVYFACRLRLSLISHRICISLYRAGHKMIRADMQSSIRVFEEELRDWVEGLPEELTIQDSRPTTDPQRLRCRLELALSYHSLRMIIYRPCLANSERCLNNEPVPSMTFSRMAALACIEAARSLLALLPDNPRSHDPYHMLPCWSILHYVCQVIAILTLELCLQAQHSPSQVGEMLLDLKKAMAYLWVMSPNSLSAFKAWKIFRRLMTEATSKFGIDVSDVPLVAPQPTGWSAADDAKLNKIFEESGARQQSRGESTTGSEDPSHVPRGGHTNRGSGSGDQSLDPE